VLACRRMEERLVEIEVRYTHLEREIAELSGIVFEQQKIIDYLKREVGVTRARLDALGAPSVNEPPPHY
jgi:SlyX protein